MKVKIIIFIVIIFFILVAAHAFLYFSWLRFFNITNPNIKKILGIALAILSVSFIVANLLVYLNENAITNFLYTVASIWLGTLLYLFLAVIGTWIIFLICRIFSVEANLKIVSGMFIIIALAYSVYGLWNAHYPRLKQIEVSIKNAPANWHGRTIVQISDVHLGAINHLGFLGKIVEAVKNIKPDIVFITGDLFDGAGRKLDKLIDPLNNLKSPLGTYFVTGNHETYINLDRALAAVQATNIKILRDQIIKIDGMQILGIDYPRAGQKKDIESILRKLDRTKPNIVLFHEPTSIDKFIQFGVNLQLAGHTHVGQLWPFNYITRRVYHGYDYGFHQQGDYTLYTTSGAGTWGPPMRTGNKPEIVVIKIK